MMTARHERRRHRHAPSSANERLGALFAGETTALRLDGLSKAFSLIAAACRLSSRWNNCTW